MSEKRRVLIAAGGTGGHIVPAAVFGRWMEKHHDVSVTCLSGGALPGKRDLWLVWDRTREAVS